LRSTAVNHKERRPYQQRENKKGVEQIMSNAKTKREDIREMQTMLIKVGIAMSKYGADGALFGFGSSWRATRMIPNKNRAPITMRGFCLFAPNLYLTGQIH
jgi:hypothetical protein